MPEPEQGASTNTTSKKLCMALKSFGSLLVTMVFDVPQRLRLSLNIGTRVLMISFATSRSLLLRAEFSNVVLPPGAAQRSNTLIASSLFGRMVFNIWLINIDDA